MVYYQPEKKQGIWKAAESEAQQPNTQSSMHIENKTEYNNIGLTKQYTAVFVWFETNVNNQTHAFADGLHTHTHTSNKKQL